MSAPARTEARGNTGTWRWTLMLPPNWVSLPTEAAAGRAAVTRLLDRRLAHLPRDQIATVRRRLRSELRALLAEARDAGAGSVHTHLALMRGLPVTATCAVALLEGGVDDPRLVAELVGAFGSDGTVDQLDVRPLAGLPAIRRRRRVSTPIEETGQQAAGTVLDWAVPLPDGEGALLMSFSTLTEPVVEELVQLFDAIAASLLLERSGD